MGIDWAPMGLAKRFRIQLVLVGVCALTSGVALSLRSGTHAVAKRTAVKKTLRAGGTSEVSRFELQLFTLINKARAQRGVPALKLSPKLSRVARLHSEEMRDKGYMGHISPIRDRSTPLHRFKRAFGYDPHVIGENVARRAGPEWCLTASKIEKTHQGLMGSTHHRENILRPEFRHAGIGIAANEQGHYWVTELFVCVSADRVKMSTEETLKKG